ncbi:hypothetical protein PRIPAC_72299 [Pristionchus pacificus]|uniref:Uncharacterized protein n=1 Tax=Pristionchus pacificus TaxID=54126 RepID=A0A2A6C554_PRIPA|nr:hypothetical protein PRIPAC_72299 [Pristionchus pacificus]|eukprot:PDM73269.1 hypothetical protein PRIPAC_40625 [Pristionchus pacificus]
MPKSVPIIFLTIIFMIPVAAAAPLLSREKSQGELNPAIAVFNPFYALWEMLVKSVCLVPTVGPIMSATLNLVPSPGALVSPGSIFESIPNPAAIVDQLSESANGVVK